MSHPANRHNLNILAASSSIPARAHKKARAFFSLPLRAAVTLLVAAAFLTGCASGTVTVTRPDGVTITASAFAILRDTGLENFTYSTTEASKGAGLLSATTSRQSTIGASGYRGSTNIDAVIKLLEAAR